MWSPPRVVSSREVMEVVLRRSREYVPRTMAQKRQLQRVEGWRLQRLPRCQEVVFAIGTMDAAVRKWRSKTGRLDVPPLSVVRAAARRRVAPTALTSNTGHMWSAQDGPFCERQMALYLATPCMAEVLRDLVMTKEISEPQMRALCGQATHGESTRLAVGRALTRAQQRHASVQLAALGAGVGFTWVQALQVAAPGSSLAWMAEAGEVEARTGQAVAARKGQAPLMFTRAEDAGLANRRLRVDGELWTLRCSPFSAAAAASGRGREAALRELHQVATQASARGSKWYVVETTAGLWRSRELRSRYEAILQSMSGVEWEALHTSPHVHAGAPVSRWRVFYIGVRV